MNVHIVTMENILKATTAAYPIIKMYTWFHQESKIQLHYKVCCGINTVYLISHCGFTYTYTITQIHIHVNENDPGKYNQYRCTNNCRFRVTLK